jgi:beta-lactamase regulating signal transducer with metallopeptidase domain
MNFPTSFGLSAGVRLLALGISAPVIAYLLSGFVCRITAHASASVRHLVWLLMFVAMAVCLPITLFNLRLVPPILPVSPPPHVSRSSPLPIPSPEPTEFGKPPGNLETPTRDVTTAENARSIAAAHNVALPRREFPWGRLGLSLWALGFVFQSLVAFAGMWRLKGIVSRSRLVEDPRLAALWAELCPLAGRRPVAGLLVSSEAKVPLVVCLWRPVVILPDSAGQWPSQLLRTALIHELAHIARNDLFWSGFARWVAAVYWWNPVAWHGLRRLHAEAEMAADDCVLTAGLPPVDYAENLILFVRAHRQSEGALFPAIGMARARGIESRVIRILNPDLRRLAPSRMVRLASLRGSTLLIGLLMSPLKRNGVLK